MSTGKVAYVSLAISALALSASVAGVVTQRSALAEVKQQFADSGAKWTADGNLYTYSANDWTKVPLGKNADFKSTSAPSEAWAYVKVTNSGRTNGAISATAVATSDTVSATVSPQCVGKSQNDPLAECNMPTSVDVGKSVEFYIPLKDEIAALTCNKFAENNGIQIVLVDSSGAQTKVKTGSGFAISSYCADLPKAPQ